MKERDVIRLPEKGKTYIYGLREGASEEIVYVGIAREPVIRLYAHVKGKSNPGLCQWIAQISEQKGEVEMVILEVAAHSSAYKREMAWIQKVRPMFNRNGYGKRNRTRNKAKTDPALNEIMSRWPQWNGSLMGLVKDVAKEFQVNFKSLYHRFYYHYRLSPDMMREITPKLPLKTP